MKLPRWTRGRILLGAGAVAVVVVAAVIGRGAASSPPGPPPGPPPDFGGLRMDTPLPPAIAALPLTDEYGDRVTLADFRGKIVVLTDFMTLCQEICPITTAVLNQADDAVTRAGLAGKVAFVDVTVDPQRDTPAQLHAYRSFAKLNPNWTLLTGSPADIAALWKYFGVYYAKKPADTPAPPNWRTHQPLTYDIEHSDVLTFLDARGHQRFAVLGMPDGSSAPLTSGERAFLSDQGRANLADTASATWTEEGALQVISWLTGKHITDPDNVETDRR